MPTNAKLCTFDCVYCECGWNQPVSHPQLPTREQVRDALNSQLSYMSSASDRSSACEIRTLNSQLWYQYLCLQAFALAVDIQYVYTLTQILYGLLVAFYFCFFY